MQLRVYEEHETYEQLMGGGSRAVKVYRPVGEPITVAGPALDLAKIARGDVDFDRAIVGGYALTPGVPRDFWDRWLAQNKAMPYVTNGIIFAHATADGVRSKARDGAKIQTGLEPIDSDRPAAKSPELRGRFTVQKADNKDE
jgi:hypothetical protein